MDGEDETGDGGCLCGAVRYKLHAQPFNAGYCHCSLCRHSSGAPVLVFASVLRKDFEFLRGIPRRHRSSPQAERLFCGDCGTQLCMLLEHEPDTVDFAVATLDDAAAVPPRFHIWHGSRLGWFDTADALPRHPAGRPD
ncbi:GFA family protein [Vulcaniibacterium tengchongense]|uniref:CENP-V/GFA domain-containing protein n=1 Tax=Vulcaniibacterium tengchongense TaxID=1273429 RepID=A0A3N4VGP9_9GAMM|nr:GFA family protein [Vulcaniibacterium tengchongense]RPE81928.1 hypothetical protein EDC50_1131 [Vulcaniibacterium tengchongense]